MTKPLLAIVACLGVLAGGCATTSPRTGPASVVFPYKWVGLIDRDRLNEPSGIVYHAARQTLFAVGDEGDIIEMRTDGAAVAQAVLRKGADLEAITFDPSTGLIYVAVEGDEHILEVDPQTLKVVREFAIDRTFDGSVRLRSDGNGIEGMCFVPDADHPEGGTFFIANQAFSLNDPEDTSALCRVELPLRTGDKDQSQLQGRIIEYTAMPIIDMAGMHHDDATGHLFIACDSDNVLMEVAKDGTILRTWAFPGNDQEGIAVDAEGNLYIAQDSGGILKVKWKR